MGKKQKQKKKRKEEEAGAEELAPNESVRRRASDTLIRIVSDNHTKLSAMADTKAHIMLTLCAGIITLSITGILRPWGELRVASFVTLGFALLAALFAILTILPRYSRTKVPSPDDPNFNLLFFNHFSSLSEDEFTARMGRLATDPNQAQDALVRDLYQQGRDAGGEEVSVSQDLLPGVFLWDTGERVSGGVGTAQELN
jgi:hypothetical protein